jgi:hypothetical protein
MTFTPETIAALLDDEITRAIRRLREARSDLDRDIEVLVAERDRRMQEHARFLAQYDDDDEKDANPRAENDDVTAGFRDEEYDT